MKRVKASAAEALKIYDMTIYQSLNRSDTRTRALLLMKNFPEGIAIAEIARCIGANYANTWGAIVGDDTKYKVEYSLIGLGLVSRHEENNFVFLTLKGFEVLRMLEEKEL